MLHQIDNTGFNQTRIQNPKKQLRYLQVQRLQQGLQQHQLSIQPHRQKIYHIRRQQLTFSQLINQIIEKNLSLRTMPQQQCLQQQLII